VNAEIAITNTPPSPAPLTREVVLDWRPYAPELAKSTLMEAVARAGSQGLTLEETLETSLNQGGFKEVQGLTLDTHRLNLTDLVLERWF
jgi:hypothetical protein